MSNIASFNDESDTELTILNTEVMYSINTVIEDSIDNKPNKLIKHGSNSVVKITTFLCQ